MEAYVNLDGGFSSEEYADIKQCLETLLSIREGSQPFDREFGIRYEEIVGYPMNVAQNMLSMEIIKKVGKYEPRVEVDYIEFECDEGGKLYPHIFFIKAREG